MWMGTSYYRPLLGILACQPPTTTTHELGKIVAMSTGIGAYGSLA